MDIYQDLGAILLCHLTHLSNGAPDDHQSVVYCEAMARKHPNSLFASLDNSSSTQYDGYFEFILQELDSYVTSVVDYMEALTLFMSMIMLGVKNKLLKGLACMSEDEHISKEQVGKSCYDSSNCTRSLLEGFHAQ